MAPQSLFVTFALAVLAAAAPTKTNLVVDRAALAEPAEFTPNTTPGGGQGSYVDFPHFRIYTTPADTSSKSGNLLESAYNCYITTLGYRSTGLSYKGGDDGPWYKMNIYGKNPHPSAAGTMGSDFGTGLAFIDVDIKYAATAGVIVHEWGHALTYVEKNWVDQTNTGAWWETVANFIADFYQTSPACAASRTKYGQNTFPSTAELRKVIGDSFQVIVDGSVNTGNYYQAWPFITYLTYNPDNFAGAGLTTLRDLWRNYSKGSNETPLHTLSRLLTGTTVQAAVGKYWARIANGDIGDSQMNALWKSQRSGFNYANLDSSGSGSYRVKSARQPKYMGANIIPLKNPSGTVSVTITVQSGSAATAYTAYLSFRNTSSGATRYVQVSGGTASGTVASGEEVTLTVANTPATIYTYDPFKIGGDVAKGLDYSVAITGATA